MSAITNTETSRDSFEQLAASYLEKLRQGERIDVKQFAEQYPEHATQLKELLPTLLLLEEIAPSDPFNASPVAVHGMLGDFRILRQLGRGGMGIVYEAEQCSIHRKVALKVLPFGALVDQRTLQRFKNEVAAVASLDHPHIVEVFAVACDKGVHHYAMRLIHGNSVAQILQQMRGQNDDLRWEVGGSSLCGSPAKESLLPTEKVKAATTKGTTTNYFGAVARFGKSIAQALDYAHENGVIHRDVKPANLMVDEAGKAWITDFGLAQMEAGTQLTMTGDVLGTALYMSPEQLSGKRSVIDYRTDIYSLGVTLYEMVTLSPPFQSENREDLFRRITQDEPTPPRKHSPSIPVDLETIILKAMEKNPSDRYASALEFADDLSRFLYCRPVLARRPGVVERARKFAARNLTVITTAALVASISAIILAVGSLFLWQSLDKASDSLKNEREARLAEEDARKGAQQAEELALENADFAYRQQYRAEMQLGVADLKAGNISRLYQSLANHLPTHDGTDRRGWEWYYLLSRFQEGRILAEHSGAVNFVDWSPDGRFIATSSSDGNAIVWEANSGQRVRRFSFGSTYKAGVRWSPDSQSLAWGSAGPESALRIWNRHSDEIRTLRGHTNSIISCTWSPDGQRLATTSYDCTARIWDARTGQALHVLTDNLSLERMYNGKFSVVRWTADGESLITVGNRGVKVWDARTFKLLREMLPDTSFAWASINPASPSQLVVSEYHGRIRLLDLERMQVTHEIMAHNGGLIRRVVFSPDGSMFASAGYGGSVIVWDSNEARQLFVLQGNLNRVGGLAWNPNGKQLATGCDDGTVRVWNLPPNRQLTTYTTGAESVGSIIWSKDDRIVTSTGAVSGASTVWDHSTNTVAEVTSAVAGVRESLSPNGQLKASVVEDLNAGFKIIVEDSARNKVVRELRVNSLSIFIPAVVWSPDSKLLAVYYYPQQNNRFFLDVWGVRSGQKMFSWDGEPIVNIAWAPDSRRLAIAANFLHIHDVKSKRRLFEIDSVWGRATAVAWHPDGNSIAAGNDDGSVGVWQAETGRQLATARHHVTTVNSMDWSPDGKRIASASEDGTLKIWDSKRGDELFTPIAGDHPMTSVKWSSSGTGLAAGDNTGRIRVWDAVGMHDAIVDSDNRRALAKMYATRAVKSLDAGNLSASHMDYSRAIELAPSRAAYRLSRAIVRARQGQLEEALLDLTAAVDLDAGDRRVLRVRIELNAQLGRWEEALGDASRLLELTEDPYDRYQQAVIQLMLGDLEAYRKTCKRQWLGEPSELEFQAERRALTCALVPAAEIGFELIVPMVQDAAHGSRGPRVSGFGALLYRAGREHEALDLLIQDARFWEQAGSTVSPTNSYDLLPGYTLYFLSMACHDQGRYPESRSWFDKAEAYTQSTLGQPAVFLQPGALNWHERAVLELLQREARKVLGVQEP